MPIRKLSPSLPTDPRHYRDHCSQCAEAREELEGDLTRSDFCVVPYAWDEGTGRWRYRCPLGHEWKCFFAQQPGYFSDCPCSWCYVARWSAGEPHYERTPDYTEKSEAYRTLTSFLGRRAA